MFALKVKVQEAEKPITVLTSRFAAKLEAKGKWFSRLRGIESIEIVNLNPPKGGGRESQKLVP